jgi:hypothetical protein
MEGVNEKGTANVASGQWNVAVLPDSCSRLNVIARPFRNSLSHMLGGGPNETQMFVRLNVLNLALQQCASLQDYSQVVVQVVRQKATLGARMPSFHP